MLYSFLLSASYSCIIASCFLHITAVAFRNMLKLVASFTLDSLHFFLVFHLFTSHHAVRSLLGPSHTYSTYFKLVGRRMVLIDRGEGKRPIRTREFFSANDQLGQPRRQSFNVDKQPVVAHGSVVKKRVVVSQVITGESPKDRSNQHVERQGKLVSDSSP